MNEPLASRAPSICAAIVEIANAGRHDLSDAATKELADLLDAVDEADRRAGAAERKAGSVGAGGAQRRAGY